jgi:hypothetical protein
MSETSTGRKTWCGSTSSVQASKELAESAALFRYCLRLGWRAGAEASLLGAVAELALEGAAEIGRIEEVPLGGDVDDGTAVHAAGEDAMRVEQSAAAYVVDDAAKVFEQAV